MSHFIFTTVVNVTLLYFYVYFIVEGHCFLVYLTRYAC